MKKEHSTDVRERKREKVWLRIFHLPTRRQKTMRKSCRENKIVLVGHHLRLLWAIIQKEWEPGQQKKKQTNQNTDLKNKSIVWCNSTPRLSDTKKCWCGTQKHWSLVVWRKKILMWHTEALKFDKQSSIAPEWLLASWAQQLCKIAVRALKIVMHRAHDPAVTENKLSLMHSLCRTPFKI